MQRQPWLYRIYYAITQPKCVHRPLLKSLFKQKQFVAAELGGGGARAAPDVIVSLHGYAQPGLTDAVATAAGGGAAGGKVPVVCVLQARPSVARYGCVLF